MGIGLGPSARSRIALHRDTGMEVSVDWSVPCLLFAILIVFRYSIVPQHYPAWSDATSWAFGFLAALTFCFSAILHEVARSSMGLALGHQLDRVTLFPFVGNTQFRELPRSPSAEMAIALVGPMVHLIIGAYFISLVPKHRPIPELSPFDALLGWIGLVNMLLGMIHMIPAFPLDAGRALRAILWSVLHNPARAIRWAAAIGQLTAWMTMGLGIAIAFGLRIPLIGESRFHGLWILAGGWMLNHAAVISYAEDLVRDALSHVPVSELMHDEPATVSRAMSLSTFLSSALLLPQRRTLPVVDRGNLLGFVRFQDVSTVQEEDWPRTPIGQIMIPLADLPMLSASDDADLALQLLVRQPVEQLPVVEEGRVIGFVHRWDILEWLSAHDVPV